MYTVKVTFPVVYLKAYNNEYNKTTSALENHILEVKLTFPV